MPKKKKSKIEIVGSKILWEGLTKEVVSPALGRYYNGQDHFYFGISLPTELELQETKEEGESDTIFKESIDLFLARTGDYANPSFEPITFDVRPSLFNRWERHSIKEYYEKKKEDPETPLVEEFYLLEDLIQVVKRHVELQDEDEYLLLALWICGTYIHPLFSSYPYLFLYGAKGSGKTNLLTLASTFSFNGQFLTKPSASNIFRLVNNFHPMMALDELDLTKIEDDNTRDLLNILLVGYKRGAFVPRSSETNLDEIKMYPTYCPKILAGVKELNDMVRDRCIEVIMVKSTIDYPLLQETEEMKEIRNRIYMWALENWHVIRDEYKKYETDRTFIGREKELWYPIFAIADAFQKKEHIISIAKRKVERHRVEEAVDSIERKLLRALEPLIKTDIWLYLKDIKESYKGELISLDEVNSDTDKWLKERFIGSMLRRLGLVSDHRTVHGRSQILIKKDVFDKIRRVYEVGRVEVGEKVEKVGNEKSILM